jgi:hypothetical protein
VQGLREAAGGQTIYRWRKRFGKLEAADVKLNGGFRAD